MAQSREEKLAVKKAYRENNPDKISDLRKRYKKTHKGRSTVLLASCRRRARLSGGKMELTQNWILARLEKGVCETTGLNFSYDRDAKHTRSAFAPSIDRIDSQNPNYTPDNCRLVLWAVNCTFAEYGEEIMLPILKAIVNAKKKSTTPVSTEINSPSEADAKRRAVLAARLGEDRNDTYHHCGADAREDSYRSAKEGC